MILYYRFTQIPQNVDFSITYLLVQIYMTTRKKICNTVGVTVVYDNIIYHTYMTQ